MSRKHLLPVDHDEYLERIGLTEFDKKVYISTLDSGLVSVGEIQQLTKINDLSKIIESIRDLIDIGLIKKAQGRMPRYYAILPFMRETITIEKEFTLALDAMIQSINQSRKKISERRQEIVSIEFPSFIESLLDSYYKSILAPTLIQLEDLQTIMSDNSLEQLRDIQIYNETVKEEISLMLKPLIDFSKLLNHSFEQIFNKTIDTLEIYYAQTKQGKENILAETFNVIKIQIDKMNRSIKDFNKYIINTLTPMSLIKNKFVKQNKEFVNINSNILKIPEKVINVHADIKSEIITIRQRLISLASEEIINDDNSEVTLRGIYRTDIEENFKPLQEKIEKMNIDVSDINNLISQCINTTEEATSIIDNSYQNILLENSKKATELNDNLNILAKKISNALTSINDNESLVFEKLKTSINNEIINMISSLKDEGSSTNKSLINHSNKINKNHEIVTVKWEQKIAEYFAKPSEIITPVIDGWVDNITPVIDKFRDQTDKMFEKIVSPLINFENQSIATLIERIRFVKVMVEGRSTDLSSIIEFAKSFDYVKSSDTWVVVGLPSIYASLTDMILRTRVKVTIVIPNIDLELLETIRKIRATIRITFVTDINLHSDARFISKMNETGRVVLRAYEKKDLYACIRDSEEIILGYKRADEEMVAIRSSTPSIVELLEDRLNETVIRNSKRI